MAQSFPLRHLSFRFCVRSTSSAFPGGSLVKNPPASVGDAGDGGSIPESRRCPGVRVRVVCVQKRNRGSCGHREAWAFFTVWASGRFCEEELLS